MRGLQRARTSGIDGRRGEALEEIPSKNPPEIIDVALPGFAICPSIPALALSFGNPGAIELR